MYPIQIYVSDTFFFLFFLFSCAVRVGLLCVVCCVCEMSLKEESEARIALNAIAQVEHVLVLPPCGQVRHNLRLNFVMFQDAIAQGKAS